MTANQPSSWQRINGTDTGRLAQLGHFVARHRWPVIAIWVVLTLYGGVAAGKL